MDSTSKRTDFNINAPPTPSTATTQADAKTTKVTVSTKEGAVAKGWASCSWPKHDEWRQWVRSALPWIAGAAIVLAAATSLKRNKDEEKTAARKAKRKVGEAVGDLEERAERSWFGLKRNVEDAADEAGNRLGEKAHEVKEDVKSVGRWAGNKVEDAADTAKSTYRSAADTASRAANKVEDKVAAAGSAALATASSAEQKTGQFMRKGGEELEKDGKKAKEYYRGEQVKEEATSKWGCSIM